MVKINGIEYMLSEQKSKKLKALVNGKFIHFGQAGYQHYFDKTGILDKSLNHLDSERRRLYLARASKIKDSKGKYTKDDINSANYHAIKILW
jgi:hypothetical protein